MKLIYVADPMCTWCYAFSASVDALLRDPGAAAPLQLALLMGGLQPFTTEPLSAAHVDALDAEWANVASATGEPLRSGSDSPLRLAGFTYDTEPASRAVVTVRSIWPKAVWRMFRAVQRAFYAEGRDITQAAVLADVAGEIGVARADFAAAFASQPMRDAVLNDFAQARQAEIRAFPVLLAQVDGGLRLVCQGHLPPAELRERVREMAEG